MTTSTSQQTSTSTSSCNHNNNRFCNNCEKCCFIFLILSAWLPLTQIHKIFNDNLFLHEIKLQKYFYQLIGFQRNDKTNEIIITNMKPFECVGTILEAKCAIHLTFLRYYEYYSIKLINNHKNQTENTQIIQQNINSIENNNQIIEKNDNNNQIILKNDIKSVNNNENSNENIENNVINSETILPRILKQLINLMKIEKDENGWPLIKNEDLILQLYSIN